MDAQSVDFIISMINYYCFVEGYTECHDFLLNQSIITRDSIML